MTGPLLKSATLKTYHPVGAVGNPVYLAASQLRAAIARRLGADVADVFAIPQRNEDGDTVDWYAPNPGTVVPWSAATEAERTAARERLLDVGGQIEDLGRSMQAEVSAERQVFGRLLAHVMQFPDEQDVHLVNGQPVLTFWGFAKDRAAVGSDPLRDLTRYVAEPEQPQQESRRNGRPWWLWLLLVLLLLLLLGLLLWGLRGCDGRQPPTIMQTPFEQQGQGVRRLEAARSALEDPVLNGEPPAPGADPTAIEPEPAGDGVDVRASAPAGVERTIVDGDLSTVRRITEKGGIAESGPDTIAEDGVLAPASVVDSGTSGADIVADREGTADGSAATEDVDAAAVEDGEVPAVVKPFADTDTAAEEAIADRDGAEAAPGSGEGTEVDDAGEASADEETSIVDDPTAGADSETLAGAGAPEAGQDAGEPSFEARRAADAETATPSGNGLDAGAAADAARAAGAAGSVEASAARIPARELLNSGWRTSRTLQDPKDGSPVHLDYRLKDGAGQVRLTRKDGSTCQSDAVAGVGDGRLVVDSKQDIVCADGTNFGRPQIECTPKAGGKASCVGRYADGSSLPIEMQRQPD